MNWGLFDKKIGDLEIQSYTICEKLLSKPIVMIPAGRFYRMSIRALKTWGIEIDALADNNPGSSKGHQPYEYAGNEYVAEYTEDIVRKYGNSANYIIVSRPFRNDIKDQLNFLGVANENIYHMPVRMGDLVPTSSFRRKEEVYRHFEEIREASSMLSDEESQEQLWEILCIFCANAPVWIENLPSEEYFNTPYIRLGADEVFVDAGMFNGMTSVRFAELSPGYSAIYGIEANPLNMQIIENNLSSYRDTHIFNRALCDSDKELLFKRNGVGPEGARLDRKGNISVLGMRGDELKIKPTYIKFDIEGAEYDAISGFKETISNYKPKMAISVYHSLQDHWRIIKLVKKICPEYNLYLKHHYGYEDLYGTILYANIKREK